MRRVIIATLIFLILFLISFSNLSEAITVSIQCDSWLNKMFKVLTPIKGDADIVTVTADNDMDGINFYLYE